MRNKSTQQGFTLIELIVVIVILGILAVTAAPKFISFTTDARASTVDGLKGAIVGGMQMVYSKEAIGGKEAASNAAGDSASGVATTFGYPAATQAALDETAGITSGTDGTGDFTVIVDAATNSVWYYPSNIFNSALTKDTIETDTGNCYVKYIAAAAAGSRPTISTNTTKCDS
jgi:MSHA pilin protein MshA